MPISIGFGKWILLTNRVIPAKAGIQADSPLRLAKRRFSALIIASMPGLRLSPE